MKRIVKLALPALALLIASSTLPQLAHAQFAGGGGFEQMQQMAPLLNMMKKKMGKKRFAMLMQTMGPMMSQMMEGQGGGFGGGFGGGGFGGFGGGGFGGAGAGGFDMSSMAGLIGMVGMVDSFGGSGHHRVGHRKKIHH
jgi:hypothetical protein